MVVYHSLAPDCKICFSLLAIGSEVTGLNHEAIFRAVFPNYFFSVRDTAD